MKEPNIVSPSSRRMSQPGEWWEEGGKKNGGKKKRGSHGNKDWAREKRRAFRNSLLNAIVGGSVCAPRGFAGCVRAKFGVVVIQRIHFWCGVVQISALKAQAPARHLS